MNTVFRKQKYCCTALQKSSETFLNRATAGQRWLQLSPGQGLWLRLWLVRGEAWGSREGEAAKGRGPKRKNFWQLLQEQCRVGYGVMHSWDQRPLCLSCALAQEAQHYRVEQNVSNDFHLLPTPSPATLLQLCTSWRSELCLYTNLNPKPKHNPVICQWLRLTTRPSVEFPRMISFLSPSIPWAAPLWPHSICSPRPLPHLSPRLWVSPNSNPKRNPKRGLGLAELYLKTLWLLCFNKFRREPFFLNCSPLPWANPLQLHSS